MSKSKTTILPSEVKKKYQKKRGEHIKDVVITALVVAIIAFVGGAVFQSKQQNAIETAVEAVVPSAQASPVKE
jgi:hypothetical protein